MTLDHESQKAAFGSEAIIRAIVKSSRGYGVDLRFNWFKYDESKGQYQEIYGNLKEKKN